MSFSKTRSGPTDFGDPGPVWPTWRGCAGIDIATWTKGSLEWKKSRIYHGGTPSEDRGQGSCLSISASADVAVFVVPHEIPLKCCDPCQKSLNEAFAFFQTWWEEPYTNSNGYFGYQDDLGADGQCIGIYTWSRFLLQFFSTNQNGDDEIINHKWRDIIPFTYWHKDSNQLRMCLLRTDEKVVQRLLGRILGTLQKGLLNDPMWPYASIHEEVIHCQHNATFAVRDLIMFEETRRTDTHKLQPTVDYPRLHEVSRHATTVAEILEVNVKTLESILSCHEIFAGDTGKDGMVKVARRLLHQQFLFQSQMVFGIRCRCVSYKDRIRNEIQQAFNLVAQEEAKNSVDIAAATRTDSQAMTSIGIITTVFLPPTFISAIYSTTFFDFGSDQHSWSVSDKFYIYWASVLPATILVAAILYRGFLHRSAASVKVTSQQLVRRVTGLESRMEMNETIVEVPRKLG